MAIEILYFEGCPNWQQTLEHLRRALHDVGVEAPVICLREITESTLAGSGFAGSPTILVDGADPFPAPPGPVSLSCRRYPHGGSPTVDELVDALNR